LPEGEEGVSGKYEKTPSFGQLRLHQGTMIPWVAEGKSLGVVKRRNCTLKREKNR